MVAMQVAFGKTSFHSLKGRFNAKSSFMLRAVIRGWKPGLLSRV
jgi:hypothetical protein